MFQLTDATVTVNNEAVPIMPNSLKFTEGLGEQNVRAVSIGGGKTEQLYSNDVSTNMSTVTFQLPTTKETIELARAWKTNGNRNVVGIAGRTPDGRVTRTFTQCALVKDYEVEVGAEGGIEVEFKGNTAI